jgi:hypothetical protein
MSGIEELNLGASSLWGTSGPRQCVSVSVPSVSVFDGTRVLNLDFDRLENLTPSGGLD